MTLEVNKITPKYKLLTEFLIFAYSLNKPEFKKVLLISKSALEEVSYATTEQFSTINISIGQ